MYKRQVQVHLFLDKRIAGTQRLDLRIGPVSYTHLDVYKRQDYSWFIYVREQMVEQYGTAEQMEEYRRQAELRGTPELSLIHICIGSLADALWQSTVWYFWWD